MTVLYTLGVFVSACLLFSIQPMAGKWLLPSLGGSPAVWITSMLFFQVALLAGYAWAHAVARVRDPRLQVGLHTALLLVAVVFVPPALGREPPVASSSPTMWLAATLAAGLGVPLVALAATGPLLQCWYAATGSRDPYRLYAASNLGSLGALIAYPFAVEPWLPVHAADERILPPGPAVPSQSLLWSLGFIAFIMIGLGCGATVLRRGQASAEAGREAGRRRRRGIEDAITWRDRGLWLALSAVPSSAMLGTTLLITTDVAAVPLLWILPLALYLLTFILAFARPGIVGPRASGLALAVSGLAVVALRWAEYRPPPGPMIVLTLLTLFVLAWVCHDRLARSRPSPDRLTEFYLWIALGGALGGAMNAVVAPAVFDDVFEYPVVLVLAMLLRPVPATGEVHSGWARRWVLDLGFPAVLALVLAGLHLAGRHASWNPDRTAILGATVGCLLALVMTGRQIGFAVTLAVLFVTAAYARELPGRTLLKERTFFGVLRVDETQGPEFRIVGREEEGFHQVTRYDLFHGTTRHGRQVRGMGMDRWGASYYHPTGPIGRLFRGFRDTDRLRDVAIIGLGVGSLASYGRSGQTMTFYEIDPEVVRIAGDPALFTFLRDSRAAIRTQVGDGRILVSREPDGVFDLVVVDGFTSDAIPVHLMTVEAFRMYLRKLRPDGLLALHLSNEHFDLLPVVRAVAAEVGVPGLQWEDHQISAREQVEGKSASLWAVVSPDPAALDPVRANGEWVPLADGPLARAWTDALSSPLAALRP